MKHFFFILFLFFASRGVFANSNEAVAYNDKIITEQNKISETLLTFSGNPNEFSLSNITTQVDKSLDVLKGMKAFDGNKDFLISAKALFKFYKNISENEYKKILYFLENKRNYPQEELDKKVDELTKSIAQSEGSLDASFQYNQRKFAEKYGFALRKNSMADKFTIGVEN